MVGFTLRTADGRKVAPSGAIGASRGLIVPATIHDSKERVLIVEGATDAAACAVLGTGFRRAAEQHWGGGTSHHAAKSPGRVDRRRKRCEAEQALGRAATEQKGIATRLATDRDEPIAWTLPPEGVKDVREWLSSGIEAGLNLADTDACHAAGKELVASLLAEATDAEPQEGASVAEQLV